MRRDFCFTALILGALAYGWAYAQTVPRGYEIVNITHDNGRYDFAPRINRVGQVVFASRAFPSLTDSEIWLYDKRDGSLTQITNDDIYDGHPDISDDGTIVWERFIGPNDAEGPTPEIVMRSPDGVITRITNNAVWDYQATVNNHRQIVWFQSGHWACGGPVQDVYMYDRGETRRITTSGETNDLENQRPSINDFGEIAWTEYNFCNPPPPYNFTSRIMLYSNGETRALPLAGVAPQRPEVNEIGWVAWKGFDPVLLRDTVEVWDGRTTTLLTDDGGVVSINNLGDIAFDRWDAQDRQWRVWLYRDEAFTLLTDEAVWNISPHMNDQTEIVWESGSALQTVDIHFMRRFGRGDMNCDRTLDAFDVEPMVQALFDPDGYGRNYPECDSTLADINSDGIVDSFDIEPFVSLIFP